MHDNGAAAAAAAPGDPGMGIQIIDPKEIALRERRRTVVMNTRKLHALRKSNDFRQHPP